MPQSDDFSIVPPQEVAPLDLTGEQGPFDPPIEGKKFVLPWYLYFNNLSSAVNGIISEGSLVTINGVQVFY